MEAFADRLLRRVRESGTPLVVGLDPFPALLPAAFAASGAGAPDLAGFGRRVLERVKDRVAAVKIQVAFYERWGAAGWSALLETARVARELGLPTIADAKRGDIASTAQAYARAFFPAFDALTVNPYLGEDAIRPFLEEARRHGGGVFVLVRTSNPGAAEFQDVEVEGEPFHLRVARRVAKLAAENVSRSGYGDVGAVVGLTAPAHLIRLRRELDRVVLLVPGYGAQGGRASDLAGVFDRDGFGALVPASREIVFAGAKQGREDWEEAMDEALDRARRDLAGAIPGSGGAR